LQVAGWTAAPSLPVETLQELYQGLPRETVGDWVVERMPTIETMA
jgi:hypothetical protein